MNSRNACSIVVGVRQIIFGSKITTRSICSTKCLDSSSKVNLFDINFDRRVKVDYKDSIAYLESEAFKKTYGGELIWKLYRRNHKNQMPSKNTRPNCINQEGFLMTSYPCPICRDEYLVLHPLNTKLLEQFIDSHSGKTLTPYEHSLCQKQYRNLIIALHQARDLGTVKMNLPERYYNYDEYYDFVES